MVEYLACLKRVRGTNDRECRLIAKEYLKCRMDRQLMAKDEMENLGFQENEPEPAPVGKGKGTAQAVEKLAGGDRLEELKRENLRLVEERKKREAEGGR